MNNNTKARNKRQRKKGSEFRQANPLFYTARKRKSKKPKVGGRSNGSYLVAHGAIMLAKEK